MLCPLAPALLETPLERPRRSFAGKHAAGDGDILATGLLGQVDSLPQGTVLAHLRQLDQHGKIHSCEHVHIWTAHAGNSQVRRRTVRTICPSVGTGTPSCNLPLAN